VNEHAVIELAASQRSIVTHRQLLAGGLSRKAIASRRRSGRLQVVFKGVYAYGCGVLPALAREQAALLVCGDGAFLSHRSAAAMWRLLPDLPPEPEVTVRNGQAWQRAGIRLHRATAIDPRELGREHGLLVSSPARALLEIAAVSSLGEVEHAFDEAFGHELLTTTDMHAVLARHPGARGSLRLRALLQEGADEGFLRSRGERAFRALLRKARITQPQANQPVGPYTVDFLWRQERLIVEFDGWDYHRGRAKFESDRARDTALKAMGFEVIRFTWRQVFHQPELVLFRLGQVLGAISLRARTG
jgi:very-short-patch-repair endonuclease